MHRLLLIGLLGIIPVLAEDAILEHAREANLDLASHMPNFMAHEVVTDYVDQKGSGMWKHNYTAESEITVKGNQISRQDFRRNGKPFRQKDWILGGAPPTGFAAALQPLFDPHCPTMLEFAGEDELRGKAVFAYQFQSPANGCFGNLYFSRSSAGPVWNAARKGKVFIDGPSGHVIRLEEDAYGFPAQYNLVLRHQVMTWDSVKIGDASYSLPVSAEFIWTFKTPYRRRQVIEYRNHRHFESAAQIEYK